MAKARNSKKKCKKKEEKIQKQKRNPPQLQEKQHSWAVVRSLFTCKHLQTHIQQQQQQEREEEKSQPPKEVPRKKQQKQQEQVEVVVVELESNKKCKKMKCSGSLCSNTKVMHRPEVVCPDDLKKRANSMGSSNSNSNNCDVSSRSMKVTLNELNNGNGSALVTSSSSLAAAAAAASTSPLITGSFKAMPFRKLSGCYECRMVVDPVLGMTRDPSLRATISSCPDCGEIFMKPENLELHQATRHAGKLQYLILF